MTKKDSMISIRTASEKISGNELSPSANFLSHGRARVELRTWMAYTFLAVINASEDSTSTICFTLIWTRSSGQLLRRLVNHPVRGLIIRLCYMREACTFLRVTTDTLGSMTSGDAH